MKFLILIATLVAGTAFARTGDVSFDYEVMNQIEQVNERMPQSVDEQEEEDQSDEPKHFMHHHHYLGGQGAEQEQ